MDISAQHVTIILGVVAPLLTGVLLRPQNPPVVKVLVAGAVAALFTSLAQAVGEDGSAFLSEQWFTDYALAVAAQLGAYFGIWEPVLASKGGVNRATGPGVVPGGSRPA